MTAANPAEWNQLGALEPDSTVKGAERRVVPGVPAVSQPVALAKDEWVCGGCGSPITESGETFRIVHEQGCSAIASIASQVRR